VAVSNMDINKATGAKAVNFYQNNVLNQQMLGLVSVGNVDKNIISSRNNSRAFMIDTVSETQEEMMDEASEEHGTDQDAHMEEHAENSEQNLQEQFDGVKEDMQGIGQDLVEGLQTLAADLQGFGKIVVSQLQIMTGFTENLYVEWPKELVDFAASFAVINFDVISAAGPCTDNITYYNQLTFILAMPVLLILVIIGLAISAQVIRVIENWKTVSIRLGLMLIFLVYPACSAAVIKMLVPCREISGVKYITADYRLVCGGDEYWYYVYMAYAGLVVYPIGCPLLYLVLLVRNRHKLESDEETCNRMGFIYERYEKEYYWFEVVEMIRKLFLTGIILLAEPGSVFQLACALLIAAYFMAIHIRCLPFKDVTEDFLQTVSLISTVLVLVSAIMIKSSAMAAKIASANHSEFNSPPAMLLVLINGATVVLALILGTFKMKQTLTAQIKKMAALGMMGSFVARLCCRGQQQQKGAPVDSTFKDGVTTSATLSTNTTEVEVEDVLTEGAESAQVQEPKAIEVKIVEPSVESLEFRGELPAASPYGLVDCGSGRSMARTNC